MKTKRIFVCVRPEERRIWAWQHKRGAIKHGIEDRLMHETILSDGYYLKSDVVQTFCGLRFDRIDSLDGDEVLPWCKTCERCLKKMGLV